MNSPSETLIPELDNLASEYGQICLHVPTFSCYADLVVSNENYAKLLAQTIKAMQDRVATLREQREKLVAELAQVETLISSTNEDIATATTIWGRSPFGSQAIGETKPLAGKGFGESVEYVLRTLGGKFSPTEMRDKMQEWGYDFSKYESDVVSSIHTTLKRLKARDKVKEFSDGPRLRRYQWVGDAGRTLGPK